MRTHASVAEVVLKRQQAYRGISIEVLDKTVRLPDDRVAHRDVVTYPGGAVCVVAVTNDERVVLVRQFRPAPEMTMLEIPAGRRSVHEHLLTAARRELSEETGYVAARWKKCATFWPSPGFVDERLTLFLAQDLTLGRTDMDADEFITTRLVPVSEALRLCQNGRIIDAKTLVGLLWYAQFERQSGG